MSEKDLARQLPALANVKRLNKHMIVQESTSRHARQHRTCLASLRQIQALIAERDDLLQEVNVWRSSNPQTLPAREPLLVNTTLVHDLSEAEQEVFGTFPNGFETNPGNDGQEGSTSAGANQNDYEMQASLPAESQFIPQRLHTHDTDAEPHGTVSELVEWPTTSGLPEADPPLLDESTFEMVNAKDKGIDRPGNVDLHDIATEHDGLDFLAPDAAMNTGSGFADSLVPDQSSAYWGDSFVDLPLYQTHNIIHGANIVQF